MRYYRVGPGHVFILYTEASTCLEDRVYMLLCVSRVYPTRWDVKIRTSCSRASPTIANADTVTEQNTCIFYPIEGYYTAKIHIRLDSLCMASLWPRYF